MTKPSLLAQQSGYTPPRYKVAQRSSDALLDAGRELLRKRTIDTISVQELCAHAQLTTGAFYGRFASKEAYVQALLALASHDMSSRMQACEDKLMRSQPSLLKATSALLRTLRLGMLRHEGVLRASLQDNRRSETWAPFRMSAQIRVEQVTPFLIATSGLPDTPAMRARVHFSFQLAIGTLVNALLNDPGPLRLNSPALDQALTTAFIAYIHAA